MPSRIWALTALMIVSLMTGNVSAQPATRQSAFPSVSSLSRFGLKMAWWNRATMDSNRETVRHLTADEQIVYVQSTAGLVTAIDMETGRKLWSIQLGRKDAPSYAITSNDELALVLTGLDLYAINKWTGDLSWRLRMPAQPSTSPVMDEEQVFVGMLDGAVFAFRLKTIRELFDENRLPKWSYQTVNWRYKTAKTVHTPPIPYQGIVNFASEDMSLYSVTKEEKSLKFQLETDAPVSAGMTQSDGYLFLASQDFNVYAINLINGKIRWQFVTGVPILEAPCAVGNNLYVAPRRAGLYQLSTVSGRQRWWKSNLTNFVAESLNYTFATNQRGDLEILDKVTGGTRGILPLRNYTKRIPNERTDRVIMATPSGLVIMLHERDQEFPLYHMNPEHRPIVPEFAEETPAQP